MEIINILPEITGNILSAMALAVSIVALIKSSRDQEKINY